MNMNWPLFISALLISFVSSILLVVQIYHLVLLDANSRGIQHPRFWALFSASSQGGNGILIYLLKRRGYLKSMSAEDRVKAEQFKRRIWFLLLMSFSAMIFVIIGLI